MKKQIVRVSVLQSAKVLAVMYFVISLPIVLIMALPMLFTDQPRVGFGVGMMILMPILYAVFGFLFSAFGAWIYNLLAPHIGGFEFTTVEVSASQRA